MNNYIESLNIGENVFVLTEDSTLECLIHFAAPFTGSVSVVIPKGTCFALHGPMRDDAFYMDLEEEEPILCKTLKQRYKTNTPNC